MTIAPLRAAIGLFVIAGALVAAALWATREPPRTRIDLPLNGGPDRMIWLCTQPGALDEARTRALAAHAALDKAARPLAEATAEAMLQAMRAADAEGRTPDDLPAITRDGDAAMGRLFDQIDAEFGCTPQEIVTP